MNIRIRNSLPLALALGLGCSAYILQGVSKPAANSANSYAVCHVGPKGRPCNFADCGRVVTGKVMFEASEDKCNIVYAIYGLKPGLHGFRIHKYPDVEHVQNGLNDNIPQNEVYLGNIRANARGDSKGKITDNCTELICEQNVVGKYISIYADEADSGKGAHCVSTSGNAGTTVAWGTVTAVHCDSNTTD